MTTVGCCARQLPRSIGVSHWMSGPDMGSSIVRHNLPVVWMEGNRAEQSHRGTGNGDPDTLLGSGTAPAPPDRPCNASEHI